MKNLFTSIPTIFIILTITITSCNNEANNDSNNEPIKETKTADNSEVLIKIEPTIKEYLLGKTFFCSTIRKTFNEFDDVSIEIDKNEDREKIRFYENEAIIALFGKQYHMKTKYEKDLIYFSDLSYYYPNNPNQTRCYKVSKENDGIKLITTDKSILNSTAHMGSIGLSIGYYFSENEKSNNIEN